MAHVVTALLEYVDLNLVALWLGALKLCWHGLGLYNNIAILESDL